MEQIKTSASTKIVKKKNHTKNLAQQATTLQPRKGEDETKTD
jgi:hypothetical protein